MFNRCVPNRKLVGDKNEMTIIILQRLQRSIISSKQNKENSTEEKNILDDFFFIQNTVHISKVLEFSGTCYKFKTN